MVATICDQGRPNEGAIHILKNGTRSYYIKNNIPYKDDFYEIEVRGENGNVEPIVHLFDVPHLMKCIRNNMLTNLLLNNLVSSHSPGSNCEEFQKAAY